MSHVHTAIDAGSALKKLVNGNEQYVASGIYNGDVSDTIRLSTAEHGQQPYAIIITCSDSRVIPEAVFSAGIGDLFVIRVAGNVIDNHQLGSIEYAAEHLGTKLAVVLGHTGCGAVDAAMNGEPEGYIGSITDEIRAAIGNERDADRACFRNVMHSVRKIEKSLGLQNEAGEQSLSVLPAVYDIASGRVEFFMEID